MSKRLPESSTGARKRQRSGSSPVLRRRHQPLRSVSSPDGGPFSDVDSDMELTQPDLPTSMDEPDLPTALVDEPDLPTSMDEPELLVKSSQNAELFVESAQGGKSAAACGNEAEQDLQAELDFQAWHGFTPPVSNVMADLDVELKSAHEKTIELLLSNPCAEARLCPICKISYIWKKNSTISLDDRHIFRDGQVFCKATSRDEALILMFESIISFGHAGFPSFRM